MKPRYGKSSWDNSSWRHWILAPAIVIALTCQAAEPSRSADAVDKSTAPVSVSAAPAVAPEPALDKLAITHHSMRLGDAELSYVATAGYMPIPDRSGKVQAKVFFVAYVKEPSADASLRPITFAFNGGPGASSVFLHVGALGPKRALLAADGTALPASTRLVDNQWTWLDVTDLVFVDPVGTGYSASAEGVDARQFYDVSKDVQIASAFVRHYVTRFGRWLSPKFVVGESYGTARAAGLADRLQNTAGINLSGLLLLSSALNSGTFAFRSGNDLPYALALPSYTAVAWYHKKLGASLQASLSDALQQAEQWATSEYIVALAKGDRLSAPERARVVEKISEYTGLSKAYIQANQLRVGAAGFEKQLLGDENRIVGRLDGRVKGIDVWPPAEAPHYDPALFVVTGPFVSALVDYLHNDLRFETQRRYEFLSDEVNQAWKWSSDGPDYLYLGDSLAAAMSRDPRLRVFAAAGYFDLTTPYLTQKYTFEHLGLDPSLRRNITFVTYPAGHQMYTDLASLEKLKADAASFIREVSSPLPAGEAELQ